MHVLTVLIRSMYVVSCFIGMPAMALLITAQVVARYFFSSPLQWAFEANGLLLLAVVFGCLPLALHENQHIRMDMLHGTLGHRARASADAIAALVGSVVAGFLAYGALSHVPDMLRYKESGEFLTIPYWPFSAFMGACALIMLVQFVLRIWTILFLDIAK